LPNIHGEDQIVTISTGIATVTRGVDDGAVLLTWADEQLYAAKRSGRNRTCQVSD